MVRSNINQEKQIMEQYLEHLVKGLVKYPDEVSVVKSNDEMGVLLTLAVSPDDMGVVIGREGQTAQSIRTLLRSVGMKNGARVSLKIVEPVRG